MHTVLQTNLRTIHYYTCIVHIVCLWQTETVYQWEGQ